MDDCFLTGDPLKRLVSGILIRSVLHLRKIPGRKIVSIDIGDLIATYSRKLPLHTRSTPHTEDEVSR
jgi:hypothetical protein